MKIPDILKDIEKAADNSPLEIFTALLRNVRGGGSDAVVLKLDYVNSVLAYRKADREYNATLNGSSQMCYIEAALNDLKTKKDRMEVQKVKLIGLGLGVPEVEDYEPHGLFEVDHLHALHREATGKPIGLYNGEWVKINDKGKVEPVSYKKTFSWDESYLENANAVFDSKKLEAVIKKS